jgi:hypothetical protein
MNYEEWDGEPVFERFKKIKRQFDDRSTPRRTSKKLRREKPQKRRIEEDRSDREDRD